jgi:hypothetical protein
MRKVLLILTAAWFVPAFSPGQSFVRDLRAIPFFHDTTAYTEPLSGGINAPMQQFYDLDGDGDQDLFIFDNDFYAQRLFFRNAGNDRQPEWVLEPGGGFNGAGFLFWFRLTDIDSDGKTELMTDDSTAGVRAWENAGSPTEPFWQVSIPRLADTAGDPVIAGFGSLPGFADLNGDSLTDYISGNTADGSFNYYRNTGSAGSPAFTLVSTRLDDITIIGDTCQQGAFLRPAGKPTGHGAGAVCLGDIDGNGTTDLFYGDIFSHSLFSLMNIGTPGDPMLECSANLYPPDSSLSTVGFNQGTLADIDHDGDSDLFVGILNSRTTHSFWFYENEGNASSPDFHLRTTDYIQTLDAGQNAHPALADLDGDDDLDLVIGNNAGALWFFRNTGSTLSPSFLLEDTLFGGIAGNFSYAPAFGDIDADGDPDLVLGRFDGRVIIYRNDGPAGYIPADTIISGQYASPAIGDIDNDNDPDLVIGTGSGTLALYINDGDSANFNFVPGTDSSIAIDVGSNARPCLKRNRLTGLVDLYVTPAADTPGSAVQSGIYYFMNSGTGVTPRFQAPIDHYGPGMPYEPAVALGDLDGDGDDDLLVGSSKGGLVYFRNDGPTGVEEGPGVAFGFGLLQNYPNPFNGSTVIAYHLDAAATVGLDVFDLGGRLVGRLAGGPEGPGRHEVRWEALTQPTGTYYVRLTVDGRVRSIRMILIK